MEGTAVHKQKVKVPQCSTERQQRQAVGGRKTGMQPLTGSQNGPATEGKHVQKDD